MKSHTGGTMSLGTGAIYSSSSKQKLNTKSSTESELVGANDILPQALWTKYFLIHQGYDTTSVMNQDNQSTMRLEENGKMSSGKRTRHINIRYFFITDNVKNGNIVIQYCPTHDMVADYYTKPLQGKLFYKFRDQILGLVPMDHIEIHKDHRSVLNIKSNNKVEGPDINPPAKSDINNTGTMVGPQLTGSSLKTGKTKSWADVVRQN